MKVEEQQSVLSHFLSKNNFLSLTTPTINGNMVKLTITYAPLAQLAEHLTLNQGVHGSNP